MFSTKDRNAEEMLTKGFNIACECIDYAHINVKPAGGEAGHRAGF